MVESAHPNHRPSIVAKRTYIRAPKHQSAHSSGLPTPPRTVDRLTVGLGYTGLGIYIYHNLQRFSFSPLELSSITLGTLGLSYGLFDLGRRYGMMCGASLVLQMGGEDNKGEEDEDSWKGKFRGQEFEDLKVADKIAWLRQEENKIRGLQADEQLRCGQAYIAKEAAYLAYEKHGNYGGADYDTYVEADIVCQDMYDMHQKQLKRLGRIREEINDWSDLV